MDTLLYDLSIPAISSLQTQLNQQAGVMQLLSVVFDPKYAFLIYSPIAYLLDHKVGKKLILTTVIAEWLNMILKWFLHGERPYWYVHSSGHFDPEQTPIKQFPITCELGPGHPSGHAMVTAAVWYIILDSALQHYNAYLLAAPTSSTPIEQDLSHNQNQNQNQNQISNSNSNSNPTANSNNSLQKNHVDNDQKKIVSGQLKLVTWSFYAILLVTISISRVFLGCHFPHQCLAGAILGFLVAKWVSTLETKARHYIISSVVLLITAFGTFALLQALGLDPSWTIRLATKHCTKREYIHLDTAPFFSIMRYCGFALGCGLGLWFPLKNYAKQLVPVEGEILVAGNKDLNHPFSSRNLSWFSAKLVMALLMARLVDNMGLFVSHANLPLFYSSAFGAYTLFSYAFINL